MFGTENYHRVTVILHKNQLGSVSGVYFLVGWFLQYSVKQLLEVCTSILRNKLYLESGTYQIVQLSSGKTVLKKAVIVSYCLEEIKMT